MRYAYNSEFYVPLQGEYLKGQKVGTDILIYKNRFALLFFIFTKKKNTPLITCLA